MKFCVRCRENFVPGCDPQTRGIRKGCVFNLCLFKAFINIIVKFIAAQLACTPVIAEIKILGKLFVDGHDMAPFEKYGRHKKSLYQVNIKYYM